MKSVLFLTAAILSISLGHILRGLRWRLIIEEEETNRSAQLLNALSWGYLLNLILPLKLGEIMRMYIAGKGQPTKFKATVIASVFYERLLDLIYVCAICIGILLIWLNSQGSTIPLELLKTTQYFVLGVILLISAITISLKAPAFSKILILKSSRLLEPELARIFFLVAFIFIDLIKRSTRLLRRKQFHTLTILMWTSYLLSYFFTGTVLYSKNWIENFSIVWLKVFSFPNSSDDGNQNLGLGLQIPPLEMLFLSLIPTILLLILTKFAIISKINLFQNSAQENSKLLEFASSKQEFDFLTTYFTGDSRNFCNSYITLNQNIKILRDKSGSSGAITIFAERNGVEFFRKYGDNHHKNKKLQEQISWLRAQSDMLVPEIMMASNIGSIFHYDMKKEFESEDLISFIHATRIEEVNQLFLEILEQVNEKINKPRTVALGVRTVFTLDYVEQKVFGNLEFVRRQWDYLGLDSENALVINGINYGKRDEILGFLESFPWASVIQDGLFGDVHGDLTIENIIYSPSKSQKFFLIDPNPFDSVAPIALDFSKLMQSLDLGFEFRTFDSVQRFVGNKVKITDLRSHQYVELQSTLQGYINKKFPSVSKRELQAHLVIHLLRLQKDIITEQGVMFFRLVQAIGNLKAISS